MMIKNFTSSHSLIWAGAAALFFFTASACGNQRRTGAALSGEGEDRTPTLPAHVQQAMARGIVVAGRTSTLLKEQPVQYLGSEIPATFSGEKVHNTAGFSWWASQHYALKTDYPRDKAEFYLNLLEMAYPHYVELFGGELANPDAKRMTIVYASSSEKLVAAMASDGFQWTTGAGGITMTGNKVAYQYPSGSLLYHQRYIIIHEAAHLYQMCLHDGLGAMPFWYFEGIADMVSSHVYDQEKKQLTLAVFDKGAINNWADDGLTSLRQKPRGFRELAAQGSERGVNFLMLHYFWDDPERLARFRIWQDEMFHLPAGTEPVAYAKTLFDDLFGDQLDPNFADWIAHRQQTFHYEDWGWEQDGESLVSYGFAPEGKLSRTDLLVRPGEAPTQEALVMDYPVQPLSALVGKVGRGGDQPSFGALIDFSRDRNRGVAGLGVGVDGAVFGTILIDAARSLVCDLTPLGGAKQTETLPSAFADALARNGWLIGMTVTIRPAELQVELGAGDPAAPVRHTFAIPLDTTLRATLLTRPLAVLARGGYHGVTPYLDVVRQPTPDLSHPRAPNRQYNPGDSLLSTLTRVTWLLRNHAPASLQASLQSLRTAAAQDYVDQQKAYFNFFDGRQALLDDIRQVGTWSEPVEEAVARLASLQP